MDHKPITNRSPGIITSTPVIDDGLLRENLGDYFDLADPRWQVFPKRCSGSSQLAHNTPPPVASRLVLQDPTSGRSASNRDAPLPGERGVPPETSTNCDAAGLLERNLERIRVHIVEYGAGIGVEPYHIAP